MKQFSDLRKNVSSLRINVDAEYTTYLAEDEIKKYYAFAHLINIPQSSVSQILKQTQCEEITSVKRIWQMFLPHLKSVKQVGYNPYCTGGKGVVVVHRPRCACTIA